MARKYKCPYCDFKDESPKLIRHIERKHEELIPEGYTPARLVYNIRNKREFGSCMICKKRTEWDESTGRYKPFCSQACHDKYVKRFEDNMIRVRGKARILDDPQQQEKMLANRKISGKYKFRDGGERTYTGSYEHKALEFLDKVMNADSKDIMTPGPTLQYEYGGKTHTWITDIYWISLNLIIEVKDGGNNPNNREMKSYREKQIAKEKMITDKGTFHYLRLTNNNFEQLFNIAAEIKMSSMEDENDTIIRINESTIDEVGPVGGMPPKITHSGYLIDKGFNGIDPTKDDDNYYSDEKDEDDVVEESVLANDIISDRVVRLNEDGIPESVDKSYLDGSKITIYKFLGDKKRFLEVASSKKPVNDFYEALTGKKRLTENQIEYDPMFERVNLRKEYNRIAEDLVTMEQEMMLRSNKALPYLPVMNIKDMESAEKILKKYKSLNIAEDVNGYFLYNRFTGRRGMSVRDINKLIVEDTCLLEESKDKSEDTDEKLADREANDYMSSSINAFIDDNVKTKAELDREYNDYMSMTQDDRKRADDKSIELYGKDNIERYEEKNREFLKQDIKPNTTGEYDGVRSEAAMSAEDALSYANFPFMQDMFEEKIKPSAKMKKEDWENFKFGNTDRCLMYSMDDSSRVGKLISGANKYLKIGSKSKKCDCPYKVSCERNDGKANIYLVKEATYNFEYVKYGQDEIDHAKVWSANAMRVIITPTKTLEDLEFLWNQFQQQHRKLQRESDWKSQELFGMDNQTHYIYLKRKFVKKDIDDDPVEHYDGTDDSILDEVYMEKGTDLSRNLNLFTHGNTKVLFITGITGSGKSTLARQLAKVCNAKLVSLDSLEKYKNLKEANYVFPDMVENYMNKYGDRIDLCKYIVENANEKYIIEGVQVVDVFLRYPDIFDKSALILKQTPLKEAVVRKFKRDVCNLNLLESLKDAYTSYLDIKEFKKKLSKNILVPIHTNNLQSTIFENGEVYSDLPMYTPTTIGNLLSYYGYEGDKMPAWAVEYDRCASKGAFSDKFWELNKERMENLKKVFKTTKENSLSRNIECIHWGWNPNVEFNDKNRAKNDRKMSKWFREESRKGYVEEKAFPLQFDKDGDLIYTKDPGEIDYAKEWKKSHDLLKEYDKMKNIESMKYELCRMWLIANNLEYYKGTKFGDMKRMRDTRALALNDFKKYIKVVMKYDKSFNFGKYYEASPFNQNTLRIHKSTLDYSMEYIKKLIGII